MIQSMRELAQSVVARILVGIIIVLLLLFGYGSFDVFNTSNSAVAEVDGEDVERVEYEREVDLQRRMSEGPVDDATLQRNTLDTMIKRRLLLNVGRSLGLAVDKAGIEQRILAEPAFAENGRFSKTLFQQRLASAGMRPQDYRDSLADSAIFAQLQQGLGESEFMTPVELRRVEALLNQQRDFAWVDVDPAAFTAEVQFDDAAVKRYFDANGRRFQVPESSVVEYISITTAELAKGISITDADINAEYARAAAQTSSQGERRHAAHILLENKPGRTTEQAIALLQAAAKRIAAGSSFAEVATELSEDTLSKDLGGDLGFVAKGELPEPALDAALWKLSAGSVSAPVVSRAGVHLLTLLEVRAPTYPPLAEVRSDLQAKLLDAKAKEKLASARSELAELAYERELAELSKRYAVPLLRSAAIPRNGVTTGIGANAAVRAAAFSDEVRDGANSSVLDVDGGLLVLRLVSHQAGRAMSFAEARDRARVALTNEKRVQLARQRATALVNDVRRTGSLTPSIQALAVTWQSRALAQRAAADVPPEVLKAAFELPRSFAGAKASGRVVELGNGHLAAVVLTRVVDGLSNGASQAGLRDFLSKQSGERQFGAFLTRLEAKAAIKRSAAASATTEPQTGAPPVTTSG